MKKSLSKAFVLSLLMAILFGVIAIFIQDNKINQFDHTVIRYVQGMEAPWLTQIMKTFTWLGEGWRVVTITLVVMAFLYFKLNHRRELLFLVWICGGSALLNTLLKAIFHRARPTIHRIIEETGYSFPSGHSMAAFSLYGALAYLLWKHAPTVLSRILLLIVSAFFILSIGVSRIYLGVHYPSDVLGGYLASGVWLTAAIWYGGRFLRTNPQIHERVRPYPTK